uniref:Uncharacterized protein n=1 Tax=Elaeophora elaphi TaxID=1147741 RepID=A0A0R3S1Z6_9BILA
MKFQHFFETINPLNGFDGKESLETYMWEQSLKVEPKDPDKMEFFVSFFPLFYLDPIAILMLSIIETSVMTAVSKKPSRSAHVLRSPGIKPPKGISSAPSTSGPSNHYSGHRASGRGFSALNNYSSNVSHSLDILRPNFLPNFEDRNSYLGMVEITPDSFVFPPYGGNAGCSRTTVLGNTSSVPQTTIISTPTVPPRKKMEQLPSPLSDDAVRVVWNKEARPAVPDVSAIISLPSSLQNSSQNNTTTTPRLYPRRVCPVEPPPRPPKLLYNKKSQESFAEKLIPEGSGSNSPPPLPPKTYKRKQQQNRLQ